MSSQDYLRSYSGTTPRVITVDVRNYLNGDDIHVDCCDYGFVLRRKDLILLGFAHTPNSKLIPDKDATFVDRLERYYSFLEVVNAFVRGERGDYIRDVPKEKKELYSILSSYLLDYSKFVSLSMSKANPKKVRYTLDSLIVKIMADFSERMLQFVFSIKGNLTLTEFLLKSLREC